MDAAALANELWRRYFERDWDGAAALLDPDVVVEWPHSGERIRGRANVIAVNRAYPEPWTIEVLRVIPARDTAVTEVRGESQHGVEFAVSFFESKGGLVTRIREYWVGERSQRAEPWRAAWVEPLA